MHYISFLHLLPIMKIFLLELIKSIQIHYSNIKNTNRQKNKQDSTKGKKECRLCIHWNKTITNKREKKKKKD